MVVRCPQRHRAWVTIVNAAAVTLTVTWTQTELCTTC